MRFSPQKAYLYPVLRPGSSDYPRAEFEVELTPERIANTTALRIQADFELSDPDLLELVESQRAHYVLLVRAPGTQHRSSHHSLKQRIVAKFASGAIAGRVEARGLLIARKRVSAFQARGWHEDYQDRTYDIPAGAVLAEDESKDWNVDNAEEAPIGSIFDQQVLPDLSSGQWRCDIGGEKVVLHMSQEDTERFRGARGPTASPSTAALIMNSLYLPALIHVLHEADGASSEYEDRRWYRSLNARLLDCERPELGQPSDRLSDAQQLLEQPYATLLLGEDSP
jgi:hypothetical protein